MENQNPINLLTLPQQGTDSATAMAMMNNNPWMYKVYWYFEDWIYG